MTRRLLIFRGLAYYWRTNAAVVCGVAAAVSVLAGALVVGDSVRATLRDLALQRLGRTDIVVTSPRFFREELADVLRGDPDFAAILTDVCPLIALEGVVTAQTSGLRAGGVLVYGVDDRFWRFHGVTGTDGPADRQAFVSPALAADTGLAAGGAALVRVARPSDVPLESVQGRKDALGRTLRLTVARVLSSADLGEFALRPSQGEVRAIFVPLARLQTEIEIGRRANLMLASAPRSRAAAPAGLERLLIRHAHPRDAGFKLVPLVSRPAVSVESEAGFLDAAQFSAVNAALESTLLEGRPVLTYVANTIQVGARSVPYSLVTAMDLSAVLPRGPVSGSDSPPPLVLNDWAARDLRATVGDTVRLEFYVWEDSGGLATRTTEFRLAGVVPVNPADRDLAPSYPGITDSKTIDAWDPPFPIDLRRIRAVDESYWETYRTTPKAFVPLETGQRLWGTRHGAVTAVHFAALPGRGADETVRAFEERLQTKINPLTFGMSIAEVRSAALDQSRGATDFGQYFLYFSFFLVVAALVLASLFFKLGVEQRSREIGLLRAVGVDAPTVRRLFVAEATVLALIGAAAGILGAIGYAWLVVTGLRTWWRDAVGTTALAVDVSPWSLAIGAAGGIAAAIGCTWWTLRGLGRVSERSLLSGDIDVAAPIGEAQPAARPFVAAALVCVGAGIGLAALGAMDVIDRAAGFFGAGSAFLAGGLCACASWLRRPSRLALAGRGWLSISRLGLRSLHHRPGRSVLSIGVIASATFILIAVDAFRRDRPADTDLGSGVGGYELTVESLLPIIHDPSTPEGRRELNLSGLDGVAIEPLRLRPGDDASCLNLYQPENPRILGVRDSLIASGRFGFQASLATAEREKSNPWLLLQQTLADGAVPVIADSTSMAYVLHRSLGEDIVIQASGRDVRLRLVAALKDSIFQSELLMSESNFRTLFPDREGYRVLLVDVPPDQTSAVSSEIENALADFGADVVGTTTKLAEFHKVENTYLSTFQTLGGLGLLIGTVGLAAVLLRNVLERRRELALLGAVGYRRRHFLLMLIAESLALLLAGLALGAVSATVAVIPALIERGGRIPLSTGAGLLVLAVLTAGLLSTIAAARMATRAPLLESLRSE